jgi:hypothetical protein
MRKNPVPAPTSSTRRTRSPSGTTLRKRSRAYSMQRSSYEIENFSSYVCASQSW